MGSVLIRTSGDRNWSSALQLQLHAVASQKLLLASSADSDSAVVLLLAGCSWHWLKLNTRPKAFDKCAELCAALFNQVKIDDSRSHLQETNVSVYLTRAGHHPDHRRCRKLVGNSLLRSEKRKFSSRSEKRKFPSNRTPRFREAARSHANAAAVGALLHSNSDQRPRKASNWFSGARHVRCADDPGRYGKHVNADSTQ
jgi:hypothetical protein